MIPITINTADLSSELSLTSQEVDNMITYVVKDLSMELMRNWQKKASVLKASRGQYIRSLEMFSDGPKRAGVVLLGWLPNAIESGLAAFDQKPGFLKSSKVKYTKDGNPYLTIPFRWATSGALGEGSTFVGVLPKSIENIVRKNSGRPTTKSQLSGPTAEVVTRPGVRVGNEVFDSYIHKSSVYQGISRIQNPNENRGKYVSFRRISLKSSSNSWIHKGIQARNFADKALAEMDIPFVVDKSLDNYLNKIGF